MTSQPSFKDLSSEQQVESLSACVGQVLGQYGLDKHEVESINHEYNSTFKVTCDDGRRFALRVNVNSHRSLANLNAEIFLVNSIKSVATPKPVENASGEFVSRGWHEATGRELNAVLYTWLEGAEPGDEPTLEQVFAMGAAMAKLHIDTVGLELPAGAELSDLYDFFWGERDWLLGDDSELGSEEKALIGGARVKVLEALGELQEDSKQQPIHADLHPWNVMWHEGDLAVFDFDDCGLGLPVQDLATSLYYLDTPEQDEALLAGYKSVAPLPSYTERQMKLLLLQRRISLLNYLYETSNPEHREMIPKYQAETFRRLRETISSL
jgi:Ser/Thr protein kinase RdoA (MazF antagonist)